MRFVEPTDLISAKVYEFLIFLVEASKVQEKYEIFIKNNPTGKISYGDAMAKIEAYVKVRWPKADPMAVTYALYPAFDPQNT